MKGKTVFLLAVVMLWFVVSAQGVQKTSDEFPYKYEADVLPSADTPAYTYNSNSQAEGAYASVAGGVLTMDTETDGQDSDDGWYTLAGGTGTAWNPGPGGNITMEIRMKSYPNNAGQYNAWFSWFDINTHILLQVWHNKVSLNGVEVTGLDNETNFHVFRIVSDPVAASADQKFDLYRDGVLIIEDAGNPVNFDPLQVKFGDQTGFAESHVEVDYIRWDDSNAWEPVPPGDSAGYPYRYEADVLPSADSPAYTYDSTTQAESAHASVSGGILTLDTETDGQDYDNGWYELIGGAGTVWNPSTAAGPFTIEVRMKSHPNNSGAWNAWFEWYDDNSMVLLNVWHNKVYLNGVIVTGLDNQSDFHTFRIVSDAYQSSAAQRFDLYRDGVKIIEDAGNSVNFTTRRFIFGDRTGFEESLVEVDYIRWDDSNAWHPPQCGVDGYLRGDVNLDCIVNMSDVETFTQGWLLSTDPNNIGYVDCSDPNNDDICK